MKKISINFNFTDDQYKEVEEEEKTIDMTAGEMLTKVMQFIVKDMLNTRNKYKNG